MRKIEMPPLGCEILERTSEDEKHYASIDDIRAATPSFINHDNCGFSIGSSYSEFMIYTGWREIWQNLTIRIAGKEISFGEISPLFQFVYDGIHDSDFHGEWEGSKSVRMHGIPVDKIEQYLLTAVIHVKQVHGFDISIGGLHDPDPKYFEDYEDPDSDEVKSIDELPNVIASKDILRIYYEVLCSDADLSYKYIQQYRILEHLAFDEYAKQILSARQDRSVSDYDFLQKVRSVFAKEERSVICKYLGGIIDSEVLDMARKAGLPQSESAASFSNAIYDRRNALVHAKADARTELIVTSPIGTDATLVEWEAVMNSVIKKAISMWPERVT
jgi:hypothetical protein